MIYVLISPRGFSNETNLRQAVSREVAENACYIINNRISGWARIVLAGSALVCREIGEAARYGETIEALTEDDVKAHRPVILRGNGSRYLGGGTL